MYQRQRQVKNRLAWFRNFKKKTKNIAKTCRYFGISRYSYYFWWRRYQKMGLDGLYDQSRRPKTSPMATNPKITRKILRLRERYALGPAKIVKYLLKKQNFKISTKTVYKILKKAKVNRLYQKDKS